MHGPKLTVTMMTTLATEAGAAGVLCVSAVAPVDAAVQRAAVTSPKVPTCLVGRFSEVRAVANGTFTSNGQRPQSHRRTSVRVACSARGLTVAGSGRSDTYGRTLATPTVPRRQAMTVEGGSIATAPRLAWNRVQHGVGGDNFASQVYNAPNRGRTLWRARVFSGDVIAGHFTASSTNGCGTNRLERFAPTVSDATLATSTPTFNTGTEGGTTNTCGPDRTEHWRWAHVPYTCWATIWAGISREAPTFTFVATVAHRVTVHLASVPRTVRPGSAIAVRAHARSAAGVPTGICTFAKRAGTARWTTVARGVARKGAALPASRSRRPRGYGSALLPPGRGSRQPPPAR